jgi:hypothetical protein
MNESLEYTYKEMIRLSQICDSYTKSSFDDIKLLGAIGSLLAWKPISEVALSIGRKGQEIPQTNDDFIFFGFLAILFITAIVSIAALLKQSVVFFYINELRYFEKKFREELGTAETKTFRVAENWTDWSKRKQRPIAIIFYFLFYFVLTVLPTCFLWTNKNNAIIYLFASLFVVSLHIGATKILHDKNSK